MSPDAALLCFLYEIILVNRRLQTYARAWPLGLLCVLVSSRWLIEQAVPSAASSFWTQAVGCLLAAGCVGGFRAIRSRSGVVLHSRVTVKGVLGYTLAFSGPALAGSLFGKHISSNNGTLAMALTPVVIATTVSVLDSSGDGDLIGSLLPGLAGLTGLLLLLPQPTFRSWMPWCALGAMPLLAGAGATMSQRLEQPKESRADAGPYSLVFGLVMAGITFGVLATLQRRGSAGSGTACGLDALTALLSLLTLARMGAVRWGAQFLLIPLLGLVEGTVLLHPFLDVWSWIGMGLIALGSLRLLLSPTDERAAVSVRLGLERPLPPA